jgi:hypothetical protein
LTSGNIPLGIHSIQASKLGNLECILFWKANVRFYRLNGIDNHLSRNYILLETVSQETTASQETMFCWKPSQEKKTRILE